MSRPRMSVGHVWILGVLALGLNAALGQTEPSAPGTVLAGRPGEITSADVYVRSGPSLNHYTISKLKAGDRVSVVGETGDWFEIAPPEGSFSLISGDYVDEAPGTTRGVVNGDRVRVRAGSQFNDNKYTVQTMLDKGAEVTIVGRNPDGFLRIAPPVEATLWISKSFVALVPDGRMTIRDAGASPGGESESESAPERPSSEPGGDAGPADFSDSRTVASAGSPERNRPGTSAFQGTPLTPSRRTLDQIDADAHLEMAKPMNQRQLEPLIERYETVAVDERDVLAVRYANERVRQLRDVQSIIQTVRDMRRVSIESESARREFLQQRASIPTVEPPSPSALDAEGTLRTSALYPPDRDPRRFRLVDETHTPVRTIAYVDVPAERVESIEGFLNHRIGLRAVAKSWQPGGVEPVRVYTAGEFVLMESSSDRPRTETKEKASSVEESTTSGAIEGGLDN